MSPAPNDPGGPNDSPSLLQSARPDQRRLSRWKPLALGIGALTLAATATGFGIMHMKRERASQEKTAAASPSDATDVIAHMPRSGEIPAYAPNIQSAAARIPGPPAVPADPAPQPTPTPAAAPASQQAPRNDLADEAVRAEWAAYYQKKQELKDRRIDETQAAMRAGLTTAWGAPQGGQAAQGATQQASASPGAAMAALQGAAGAAAPRPRPGWLDQGPSDPANAWLANPVMPPISPYALMKGDTVPCRIEKNISSELGGQFTATVTRTVTDAAGRPMIPWGTRLVGTYDQNTGQGQTRLPVGFTDMVFPGVGPDKARHSISLGSMPGNDIQGAAGFKDRVNRHTTRILFSALVSAISGSAGSAASQLAGGAGATGMLAAGAGQGLGAAGQNIVGRGVNTASTIDIRRGYDCSVELTSHIPFPGVWVDGVGHVAQ